MNERIREIADRCRTFDEEKFAKLIVKETINEMIRQLWNNGIDQSNNPSFYKAVESTKQHFGVEE